MFQFELVLHVDWFLILLMCIADDYFFSRLPVVEKRIAQGGVRLAALLNRIFSKKVGGNLKFVE